MQRPIENPLRRRGGNHHSHSPRSPLLPFAAFDQDYGDRPGQISHAKLVSTAQRTTLPAALPSGVCVPQPRRVFPPMRTRLWKVLLTNDGLSTLFILLPTLVLVHTLILHNCLFAVTKSPTNSLLEHRAAGSSGLNTLPKPHSASYPSVARI
ncbi:hypothetical protein BU24DRAFT_36601 [Aaosphaeria arxii CBS 175.79]|uniref:Uncharacterized protein n=1 Tax=Aaosphaeria arxii CBS 175.79 TaxID=1450172 RepID=A0A6A5Y9X6_9PLEO|nr:uncharacterized protein BU24DRAFT_36601 [Aaosphaeria arxii CBS 175.79]KAF2022056.1 hypothetical protein BU24DRAFT_36601 [Aaosphaeria arxii CBS 175.79]